MKIDCDRTGADQTYGLANECGWRLVIIHTGGWVFWGKEWMLTMWVVITVQDQLEKRGEINIGYPG